MTTFNPMKKARFYIMVDVSDLTKDDQNEPITFTLPMGTKFPTNLLTIMEKTGRVFSTDSGLEGISNRSYKH
jgi:hypothetical protein